jgi:hypothetical protein
MKFKTSTTLPAAAKAKPSIAPVPACSIKTKPTAHPTTFPTRPTTVSSARPKAPPLKYTQLTPHAASWEPHPKDIVDLIADATPSPWFQQPFPTFRSAKSKASKYYGVAVGRNPGIYSSWPAAQAEVVHYGGAVYKGFSNYDNAQHFLLEQAKTIPSHGPMIHINEE